MIALFRNWRRWLCGFSWHSWRAYGYDAGWYRVECTFCGTRTWRPR